MSRLHIRPGAPTWPSELDEIDGAPPELWIEGRSELLARKPRFAIVGTRSPSPYGEAQAHRFASSLAAAGAVIISGLARGIDQAAHRGALDAGGATIAVLASGVDRPWPDGELTRRMAREGALLSELAPGVAPRKHAFPRRNRLISGLARGVLVVEAAWSSGSLITAHWAADQGRSVYALPGRVDHPMARGCHRILREGAQLVEAPEEILRELGLEPPAPSAEPESLDWDDGPYRLSKLQTRLLGALTGETLSADELGLRVELDLSEVLTALVELELMGLAARGPGGLYRRCGLAKGPSGPN